MSDGSVPGAVAQARLDAQAARAAVDAAEEALAAAKAKLTAAELALRDSEWTLEAAEWRTKNGIWRTGEGKDVPYGDLSDDHLENAIGFLRVTAIQWHGGGDGRHPALDGLLAEKTRRDKA